MIPESSFAPRVAEFFAGVGLVRKALEQSGFRVVFANDIDQRKRDIYALNFDPTVYLRGDVRKVCGSDVPDIELATASFPCTDLSLAGNRAGLDGKESSLLAEFLRVLDEMGTRRPKAALIENVIGFATSKGGEDLRITIASLNRLGYDCDFVVLDARHFVPQSRPRLFIVATVPGLVDKSEWRPSELRPSWVFKFAKTYPYLRLQALPLTEPPPVEAGRALKDVLDDIPPTDSQWWDVKRLGAFLSSLSTINAERLDLMRCGKQMQYATAYRRTRNGAPVWEIRSDDISGCLRTARGGSSKQAVVEAGIGTARVRWMTAREYARLQGAPDFNWGAATESQAKFALGDAVCVPAVAWLVKNYLVPLVTEPEAKKDVQAALALAYVN